MIVEGLNQFRKTLFGVVGASGNTHTRTRGSSTGVQMEFTWSLIFGCGCGCFAFPGGPWRSSRALKIHPKHRKSLPNGRQQNPRGVARSAAPWGRRRRRRLVVFHLVRISYVLNGFSGPCWTSKGLQERQNTRTCTRKLNSK